MKSRFLTLLLTFAFIMPMSANAEKQVLHDWTTPENEQSAADPLFGSAYKYASKGGSAADRWNPSLYYSEGFGSVSLEVTAELLSIGDEMNVTSWIEVTSDQGRVSAPDPSGVRQNKIEHDWQGKHYYHDSKRVYAFDPDIHASAVTSYKSHPVAAYSSNKVNPRILLPWNERRERTFHHSAWASAWASDENTPSELPEFNPFGKGNLDATSRSSLNLGVDYVEFATPTCTGSSAHDPGPCPGP